MSDTPQTDDAQFGTGRVSVDFARRLEREVAAERALADKLAALLQRDRDGYGGQLVDPKCDCCDCEYLAPIDDTLAEWKAARTTPTDENPSSV